MWGGRENPNIKTKGPSLISREKRDFSDLMFFSPRLKRTTDMMFGGKQVVVCGYGEVRFNLPAVRCLKCILLK